MKRHLLKQLVIPILMLTAFTQVEAQVNLTALNTSYGENFNTLPSAGTTNDSTTLPIGWAFRETGSNANLTYAAGTGSSTAGNTYSLGLDTDRAFGGLLSGSLTPYLGARFINNTGATITELQIQYAGEQWRLGATPRAQADRLDFQYSLNASSLVSGNWTDYDALDFNAPILSGTAGALNGNAATNHTVLNETINGLSIPAGATFWIRWTDFNVASSDDALAIDDFNITPIGIPSNQPAIVLTPVALNFGEVNVNTSSVLSYTVAGSNLSDSVIFINTFSSPFTLSLDQINFNDTITVISTDTLYVKFSPVVNGLASDSIYHYSSGISKSLYLTGSGFDPFQNIISIAEARSKSPGTKATVAGRVTVANQHGSPSFIQDASGGIPVFDFNFSNTIAIGDSVVVTGNIGLFNSQVQIGSNVSFTLADSVKRFITPKLIALGDLAMNEGLLVTVQQVEVVNKAFVFYPQSTERMTNGSVQADLRIDGDTNIPGLAKPQGVGDITGAVGRFKTNAQLLPRFREDVPGAIEPQTPFDSIPKANTFDLMNWNLEFFGATREKYPEEYGPADEPLQLQNVQHIISSIHADIIAVQEVSDDSLFTELIAALPGYKGICSDRYSYSFQGPTSTFPPQKVCFIYDSATVQVESTRVLFETRYDSARLFDASLIPNYPTGDASSFWSSGRLPFMLTANVTVDGVTEKIRFINLHAKSGSTQSDYNRREYDAAVLKDSLDAHYANDQVVILGDYNDDLTESIVSGLPTSYSNFVQDTAAYNSITRSLSLAGAKSTISFDNVIDNQIISTELNEEYLIGSEQVITPFAEVPNYASTTSDHLPVVSRFEFVPASARFTTTASTVTEGSDSVHVQLELSKPLATDKVFALAIMTGSETVYDADYVTSPAPSDNYVYVTVPANSTIADLWINVLDDTHDEHEEYVALQILPTPGILLQDSLASLFTLTILDNDATTIEFIENTITREEGSGAYAVRLKLSTAQDKNHTVTIKATGGHGVYYGSLFDYTTTPALSQGKLTLTIPAGTEEAEFKVTPNKDLLNENDEVITFSITSVSAGIAKGLVSTSTFTLVNTPTCLPVFTVFPNPTFGNVNIYTLPANEEQVVQGTLLDPRGDVVASGEGTTAQLSDVFTNALHGKKRGVYILKLKECDTVITIRIIKL
ncbi:MAG: endonuclease/exonuclease/phosphatase family protein [Chryseolinea sp.]